MEISNNAVLLPELHIRQKASSERSAKSDSVAAGIQSYSVSDTNPTYLVGATSDSANYAVQVSKQHGGTLELIDTNTGETFCVWGDPHTHINGKQFKDIYADTTVILRDGSKLTLGVVEDPPKSGLFYVNSVTLTKADNSYGFRAENLHNSGDLVVQEFTDPAVVKALDAKTPDGDLWQLIADDATPFEGDTKLQDKYATFGKGFEERRSRIGAVDTARYLKSFSGNSGSYDDGALTLNEQCRRIMDEYEKRNKRP